MKIIEIENTVQKQIFDEETQEMIDKPQDLIDLEELALITAKENEVQAEVDAYKAEIERQLTQGGRGPRGTFQAIEIVKKYNGQFEVVFKEAGE